MVASSVVVVAFNGVVVVVVMVSLVSFRGGVVAWCRGHSPTKRIMSWLTFAVRKPHGYSSSSHTLSFQIGHVWE